MISFSRRGRRGGCGYNPSARDESQAVSLSSGGNHAERGQLTSSADGSEALCNHDADVQEIIRQHGEVVQEVFFEQSNVCLLLDKGLNARDVPGNEGNDDDQLGCVQCEAGTQEPLTSAFA